MHSQSSATDKRCMFCGTIQSELTDEHVFPDWLSKAWKIHVYEARLWTSEHHQNPISVKYSTHSINSKVNAACHHCNHDILGALESRVKPLILPMTSGKQVELTTTNQIDIAA